MPMIVLVYSVLSFAFMLAHSYIDNDTISRWFWIIQIGLFIGAFLVVLFLFITRIGADIDSSEGGDL